MNLFQLNNKLPLLGRAFFPLTIRIRSITWYFSVQIIIFTHHIHSQPSTPTMPRFLQIQLQQALRQRPYLHSMYCYQFTPSRHLSRLECPRTSHSGSNINSANPNPIDVHWIPRKIFSRCLQAVATFHCCWLLYIVLKNLPPPGQPPMLRILSRRPPKVEILSKACLLWQQMRTGLRD